MNRARLITIPVIAALAIGAFAGCSASPTTASPGAAASASAAAVLPVNTNPITNTSMKPGLSVTYAAVQDNVDPATKKAIDDRLEITVKNSTRAAAAGLEVYYTMKDVTTGKSESYYQDLGSLTIAPNAETTVYFDKTASAGHYPENTFSIYRSSTNQVDFTIEVSATGLKPATAKASRGAGSGEVVGG